MEDALRRTQETVAGLVTLVQQLQDRDQAHSERQNALAQQHVESHNAAAGAAQATTALDQRLRDLAAQVSAEIQAIRIGSSGGSSGPTFPSSKVLVNAKFMRPDKYGDKGESLEVWKAWSHKLVRYCSNVDLAHRVALLAAAGEKNADRQIAASQLGGQQFPLTPEQDNQLQSLLIDVCQGKPSPLSLLSKRTKAQDWRCGGSWRATTIPIP